MVVTNIAVHKAEKPVSVSDCCVSQGYVQTEAGSLPDVDIDYQSDRRHEVKKYLEERYNVNGKQRVFAAGTYNTMKAKAGIKDVARTMRIPVSLVNFLTSLLGDEDCDFTRLMQLAYEDKKIARFVHEYPLLFEDLRTLLLQPRSTSIHPSAILITPESADGEPMECFDYTPIKRVGDLLVSEFDGYALDEVGLLKNDCLATIELAKLKQTIDTCNEVYNAGISLESLSSGSLDCERAYELIAQGHTQNIFQLSSSGMTKLLMQMKPTCITDLIAANALYRPATLENGSTDAYVNCKQGLVETTYLWGTENALKDTYGVITYQEQVVFIAREVGNFSLADGVKLVKYISKKKTDKIQAMKGKFMKGAKDNGCTPEVAEEIWKQIEACGSYLFNKSHAAAYAITSYVDAYLKANYPTAFYTTALQWANDKVLPALIAEMEECSEAKIYHPDINGSDKVFRADFSTNVIYWSIARIKQLGAKATDWILAERERGGDFSGVEEFIHRIFKYKLKKYEYWDDPDNPEEETRCPVNARHVLNLIFAGCFDKVEGIKSIQERYLIVLRAAEALGFELNAKDFPPGMIDKPYFWSTKQIQIAGVGAVDYRRAYDGSQIRKTAKNYPYRTITQMLADQALDGERVAVCGTVVDVFEKRYSNGEKTFAKITLSQTNETCTVMVWHDEYSKFKHLIDSMKDRVVVITGKIKYSDYDNLNTINISKYSKIELL